MSFEALYPVVISVYSLTVTALAVVLWWKTQTRIERTKQSIEVQVANAVKDISARVDEKLDFDMPDTAPLMAKLESMEEGLPDMIAEHMDMHFKAIQGAESKAMSKILEEMNIEGVSEEMKQVALQKLTVGQRATAKVLTMKIPRATREAHPVGAMFFDTFKTELAETIAQLAGGSAEGGNVTVESSSRGGIGVR